MNFSVAHTPITIVLPKQKKHRSLLLELPIRISHHASLRLYSMVFAYICMSGLVNASLGLCLRVWPCIGRSRFMFAGVGLYLQVWAVACKSELIFAGLG